MFYSKIKNEFADSVFFFLENELKKIKCKIKNTYYLLFTPIKITNYHNYTYIQVLLKIAQWSYLRKKDLKI